MNTQTQNIIEQINNMNTNELVELNNAYTQSANICDGEIHSNDEDFFTTFFGTNVLWAVQATQYGKYNYSDTWVKFNGYGNLDSFSHMDTDKLCEGVSIIAEYITENPEDFEHIIEFIEE